MALQGGGSRLEVEVKLGFATIAEATSRLGRLPAALERARRLERNEIFDTPDRALSRGARLLRLREVDGQGLLTWKEPAAGQAPGLRAKVRHEIETELSSPAALRAVLERLGYVVVYRYEKFRSDLLWEDPETGKPLAISLDETPIGIYVELEGPKESIDRAAGLMGLGEEEYILDDYGSLHRAWLAARGLPAGDMVFPGQPPQ